MTFDKYFKSWLTALVEAKLTPLNLAVVAFDEAAYKLDEAIDGTMRKNNGEATVMIYHGGNATKSNLPNFSQNSVAYLVSVIAFLEDRDKVRAALTEICDEQNASFNTWARAQSGGGDVNFRPVFNTPYVIGATYDLHHGSFNNKACTMQWIITVNYGANAYIPPSVYKLKIGNTEYPINYISKCDKAYAPAKDNFIGMGNDRQCAKLVSKANTYIFTIYRASGDSLQTNVFEPIVDVGEEYTVSLSSDGGNTYIKIREMTVSETFENNTAAYLLTLAR